MNAVWLNGDVPVPRKARDERLNTRSVRLALTPRAEPYWRTIQEGRAIGYRRLFGGKAGAWIARHYDPAEGRHYQALGTADDLMDADGVTTLTFAQAQTAAGKWFASIERNAGRVVEKMTVWEAMAAYVADYTVRGGRSPSEAETTIKAHILPTLGDKLVDALTFAVVKQWHQGVANGPARLRTKAKANRPNVRKVETADADARRARRATANRVLTVLKAGLTLAYREGRATSDDAWRRVKPFPNVDAPRIRYLTDPECVRLVNACSADLRQLVSAALLTGCRYQELASLKAGDFDLGATVLHIRQAKAGKRSVPLTDDAVRFFTTASAGRARDAHLLTREKGGAWGKSHQFRPLREACSNAKIAPAVSFHILRHTFASRLAMRGVPMAVVAAALGNTEAICVRHYAHLSPSYIADTIRENAGGLGIVPISNVASLEPKTAAG
jgi:integrase